MPNKRKPVLGVVFGKLQVIGDAPSINGNYEPGNVRWETKLQQIGNTRRNRIITFRGVTGCITQVCRHFNKNANAVNGRLYLGWDIEKAMLTPVRQRKCLTVQSP